MTADTDSSKDETSTAKEVEKQRIMRSRVAAELVATEEVYCKAIRSISTDFLYPIQSEGILKKEHIDTIFSNIDQIGDLHSSVLSDLQNCVENWKDGSMIGDCFMRLVPYLKLYRIYCSNYHAALLRVEDRRENSSKFAQFLTGKAEQGLDLCSLLIRPIQRIPRYRLLFAEILKYTPNDHPDYRPTSDALLQIEDIATYVNEAIREKENQDKLLQIQQSLSGKAPPIVTPRRKFIREGTLVKMCRREPKRRYFFLFNDLMIYCTVNESIKSTTPYTFHRALSLDQFRVDNIKDSSTNTAFQVLSNQKSFTVFAESEIDKEEWMRDINLAIQLNYQLNHRNSKGDPNGDSIAPVWVPDKLLKNCMVCDVKFTAINRRHHCRQCGKLLCGACSSKRFKLENLGKICRVCDTCYEELSSGSKRTSETIHAIPESEAQISLARRATKMFAKTQSDVGARIPSGAGSLLPGGGVPPISSSTGSVNNPTEDSSTQTKDLISVKPKNSMSRRKKVKRKKVKKKIRTKRTGSAVDLSSEDSFSDSMEDFDYPLPDFAPPLPPTDQNPFLDFDSSESSEYLSAPSEEAPLPPV